MSEEPQFEKNEDAQTPVKTNEELRAEIEKIYKGRKKPHSPQEEWELLLEVSSKFERQVIEAAMKEIPFFASLPRSLKHEFFQSNPVEAIIDTLQFLRAKINLTAQLDDIEAKARQGHINGLGELAFIAHEATKRLNSFADEDPDYLAHVASTYSSWPVLANLTKAQLESQQEMLRKIRLDDCRYNVGKAGQYEMTPPRKWAVRLLRNLDFFALLQGGELPSEVRLADLHEPDGIINPNDCPDEIFKAAKALPPFCKRTVEQWWPPAEKLFLFLTGNEPWKTPELAAYANTSKVQGFEGRKQDGVKRDAILKIIKQAFKTLAPESPPKH